MSVPAALELDGVAFSYQNGADAIGLHVLQDFSLHFSKGQTTALMGSSGSGKSTIAKIAAGIIVPNAGDVLRHRNFQRACDIVYVDQSPLNSVFPWLDVQSNLTSPLRQLRWSASELTSRLAFLTETFHLKHVLRSKPKAVSGGELQRLALARCLSWRPQVAILDETLSSLDPPTRRLILAALHKIVSEDGLTLILITHYPQDALDLAERIVVLGGRPATIVDDFDVKLPFPRPGTSPEYDSYETRIGRAVRAVNENIH